MAAQVSPAKRARLAGFEALVSTRVLSSSLGRINCVAVGNSGSIFVGTDSALYLIGQCSSIALCAGHPSMTGFSDDQGCLARFNGIMGLKVEPSGSVLLTDRLNHCLRRVSPDGIVTTIAGTGVAGFSDGVGTEAQFNEPWAIAVDKKGIIYVSDSENHCIRQMLPTDGTVSTLCGNGMLAEACFADGQATEARFCDPAGLAVDNDGNLLVADAANHCIRMVALPEGRVTTVAGSQAGGSGFADGEGTEARFNGPYDVVVDGTNAIIVADAGNHRLRMITGDRARVTTLAGSDEAGCVDGVGPNACFSDPWGLDLDERGRLLVASFENAGCLRIVEASLAPRVPFAGHVEQTAGDKALRALQADYGKLLMDTARADVTFVVDGQRFSAHSCVLMARSEHFRALFDWGEPAGRDIVLEDVSAEAFRVLLRYLYTQELPEEEECGERLQPGEMAKAADYFQAADLYEHCVEQFKGGLRIGNVVERFVQAHNTGLVVLEEAVIQYFKKNVLSFKVRSCCVNETVRS
jgi:DNA-binding beta-propeller fold protein YncE